MEISKQNILFIVFNRIEPVKKVLEQINLYEPSVLYISSDGGRNDNERKIVQKIREYIEENINPSIVIKRKYNDENFGCKKAVSSALNWFFKSEEAGIILEDDCLPNQSFFNFMNYNLNFYKENSNILSVNGSNLGYIPEKNSPFLTTYMNMWGWGTWARSAQNINYDLQKSDIIENRKAILNSLKISHPFPKVLLVYSYWLLKFLRLNKIDTWDYQWHFHQLKENTYSIAPGNNLVSNIGFASDATHTFNSDSQIANLETFVLDLETYVNHEPLIDFNYENKVAIKRWEVVNFSNVFKLILRILLKK